MSRKSLALGALACFALIMSTRAASADTRWLSNVKAGISVDAEFDADRLTDAVQNGLETEPVVKRGHNNSLIHFESVVPIRLTRAVQRGEDPTPATRFLVLMKDEMGIDDTGGMRLNRVRELAGGRLEHSFRQYSAEYPVLNSLVTVTVDTNGGLLRLSGRYLNDDQLHLLPSLLPSFWDLADAFPTGIGEGFAGLGIFHGSMFGMTSWDNRAPAIAFVTIQKNAMGGYRQAYVDWETGETLYSIPLQDEVLPPIDIYHDVDCRLFDEPKLYPDQVVRKDSDQTCGQGSYANGCSWWPDDTSRVRTTVQNLAEFFDEQFGRYSWDDGQMPECDPNDPNVDPNQCCNLTDPSVMIAATNWYADNSLEQGCCVLIGMACPTEENGVIIENSFFYPYACYTAYAHGMSCTDTIGHEFAHGVDFSEKQTARCTADDDNGLYCRHEEAMAEAFPDIVGEAFQQLSYPGEGSPWIINDGQTYCSTIRNLQTPTGADHASTIDWYNSDSGTRLHSNSTAISKGLYLLGRPISDGPATHYGIAVTGIGISDAMDVFYHAIVEDLPDTTDRTFSDLRQALLTSAGSMFGYSSAQYNATKDMVNSLGFWTSPASWIQALASRPGMGIFGTPGLITDRHRVVVYQESGSLKYRYRYRTFGSPPSYVWAPAATIVSTARSFSVYTETRVADGVPLSYRLHVYYLDTANKVRHFQIDGSGSTSDNPVTHNGLSITVLADSTIRVVQGASLKLFYVPSGTTTVKYADLANNVVTSPLSTAIPVTTDYDVDYQGGRYQVFWIADYLHHMVNYGTQQWVEVNTPLWLNTKDFDIESYFGRLHVMMKHKTNGWTYQTCQNDCTSETDWTFAAPIDSKPDMDSNWAVLARYYNEDFDLGLAVGKPTGNMVLRSKHSQ